MTKRKVVEEREPPDADEIVVVISGSGMLDDERQKILTDIITQHGEVQFALKMVREEDESIWDFVNRYRDLREELSAYQFYIPDKPDGVD